MAGNNFFTNNGSGSPLQPKKPSLISGFPQKDPNIMIGVPVQYDGGFTTKGTPYGTGVNTALFRQQQQQKAGTTPTGVSYGTGVNTAQQRQAQSGMLNKPTTPTATPTPAAPITPATTATTPSQITPVTNAPTGYQQTNPNVYGQMTVDLANRYTQPIGQYQQIQDELARNAEEQRALQQAVAERGQQIGTSGIDLSLATGEKGLLNQLQAIKLGGLQQKQQALAGMLGAANTQQGLQQQALGSAISAAKPFTLTPTETPYNPVTNQFVGGQTQIGRAITAANIASAQDLTQQRNQLQSTFNSADANFNLLLNTARQGGVNDMNIPALNTLQQNVARGLASDSAVINFQNTLASVRAQYANILGNGTATVDSQNRAQQAIPDNISLGALESLHRQLTAESQNRLAGIDQTIQGLQGATQATPTAPKTTGPITWDNLLD